MKQEGVWSERNVLPHNPRIRLRSSFFSWWGGLWFGEDLGIFHKHYSPFASEDSEGAYFSDLHFENLVGFREVKITKCRGLLKPPGVSHLILSIISSNCQDDHLNLASLWIKWLVFQISTSWLWFSGSHSRFQGSSLFTNPFLCWVKENLLIFNLSRFSSYKDSREDLLKLKVL